MTLHTGVSHWWSQRKRKRRNVGRRFIHQMIDPSTVGAIVLEVIEWWYPEVVYSSPLDKPLFMVGNSLSTSSLMGRSRSCTHDDWVELLICLAGVRVYGTSYVDTEPDGLVSGLNQRIYLREFGDRLWMDSERIESDSVTGVAFEEGLSNLLFDQNKRAEYVAGAMKATDPRILWRALLDVCRSKGLDETTGDVATAFVLYYGEHAKDYQTFVIDAILDALGLKTTISPA